MNRGEVWLAQVGRKRRPVVVLTRNEVLDVRALVTVAEVSTSIRGLASEVELDHESAGLRDTSVVNCDGVHTIPQSMLTTYVGDLDGDALRRVCEALTYALGC